MAPASDSVAPDPAIVRGVLANGLRYAVMRNANPPGEVSIRLGFDVGAFDETDEEAGAAHFVEHLAYGGTEFERAFNDAGVAFGADMNAGTERFTTTYRIDLPHQGASSLDLAFRWLRSVADKAEITKQTVDRERGVILAERASRTSLAREVGRAVTRFQGRGLRSFERDPIGTPESLGAMSPERLRDFYDRWYRPERAVLVVVGDADPKDIQARIVETFASWSGRGPAGAQPPLERPDPARGLDAMTLAEPDLPTVLSTCRLRPPEAQGPDDVARLRRSALSWLWRDVLNRRLQAIVNGSKPPMTQAFLAAPETFREAAIVCVAVLPVSDDWRPALLAVRQEIERLAAHGPTDAELKSGLNRWRGARRGAVMDAATRRSQDLAGSIMQADLKGDVTSSPEEAARASDAAVDGITAEEVRQRFNADWTGSGPLLSLVAPAPPSAAELRSAWADTPTTPEAQPQLNAKTEAWDYSFGRPGKVASRKAFTSLPFERVTFANGAVLNFMHTDTAANLVSIRVRFGAGRREIPNQDLQAAQVGALFFKYGGLGRYSVSQLDEIFGLNYWDVNLRVDSDAFVFADDTRAIYLDDELKIMAAYMTDPGFRPELDSRLTSLVDLFYRAYQTTPQIVLGLTLNEALQPGGPTGLPPRARLAGLGAAELKRLFGPALKEAPVEVTIVGDVDEAAAVQATAQTFGALPRRSATNRVRPDTQFIRNPAIPPTPVRATYVGSQGDALIRVAWPLYVAVPERRREEVALSILADMLTERLRRRIRDELGKTYSPSAETSMPDLADQGMMTATVGAPLQDVDATLAEVRKVASDLAHGDIPDEEIEAARKPALAHLQAQFRSDVFLAGALSGSSARDPELKDLTGYLNLFSTVTPTDVRKAAAEWLSKEPVVVIVTPAAK